MLEDCHNLIIDTQRVTNNTTDRRNGIMTQLNHEVEEIKKSIPKLTITDQINQQLDDLIKESVEKIEYILCQQCQSYQALITMRTADTVNLLTDKCNDVERALAEISNDTIQELLREFAPHETTAERKYAIDLLPRCCKITVAESA